MQARGYLASCRWVACAAVVAFGTSCALPPASPTEKVSKELRALRDGAAAAVREPARAARVSRALAGFEADLLAFMKLDADFRRELGALNTKPDATRAELEAAIDAFDVQRKAIRGRLLDRHAEMIAATSADEWATLAPLERAALAASHE